MNNLLKIFLVVVPGGIVIYLVWRFMFAKVDNKTTEEITEEIWSKDACVPTDGRSWQSYISGTSNMKELEKRCKAISKKYFGDDANYKVVKGFFKGIDVYPSTSAARFFEKYMLTWINHPKGGLEAEVMQNAELKCIDLDIDVRALPTQKDIEDALKDIDLSGIDLSNINLGNAGPF